jgi:restriction system protein
MKFKMPPNSLFAVLLRSPWWISFGIVALIVLASFALLPKDAVVYGAFAGFPLFVIGLMAAWRQLRAPSEARVNAALARAAALSWPEFSNAVEQGYAAHGQTVARLNSGGADFSMHKDGHTTLVSCKRWKAVNQGVEGLRELVAARQAAGAQQATYISLHGLSDAAQRYAKAQGVHVMPLTELALLVMGEKAR